LDQNLDTNEELPTSGRMPLFFVPELSNGDAAGNEKLLGRTLEALIQTCGPDPDARAHIPDASYLKAVQNGVYEALDKRLDLVQQWITVNVERFTQGNQDIRNLTEKLKAAALSMRAALRLCLHRCSECQLLCLRTYRHSGDHSCGTDHLCASDCEVVEEHSQREPCGLQ
jgi:hypothetical protein